MVIPEHLQIEIVAGICSADCIMCTIKDTPRKGILSINDYASILKKFEPYTDKLQYLTLHGMGEPLLDKTLPAKIALAKKKGFKGIGFATNATHLSRDKTEALLDCGLNTIIFSLDGITKKTHENIRRGVDYDDIMEKILYFIKRRNQQNALDTKIIVRMIRQESNHHECDDYRTFWNGHLSPANGDLVSFFDVHNWGGVEKKSTGSGQDKLGRLNILSDLSKKTKLICPDLLLRFIVFLSGDVALCFGDEKAVHNLGNIFDNDPIEIYNGSVFSDYRRLMGEGKLTDIAYCRNCQIILSRMKKQYLEVTGKF